MIIAAIVCVIVCKSTQLAAHVNAGESYSKTDCNLLNVGDII